MSRSSQTPRHHRSPARIPFGPELRQLPIRVDTVPVLDDQPRRSRVEPPLSKLGQTGAPGPLQGAEVPLQQSEPGPTYLRNPVKGHPVFQLWCVHGEQHSSMGMRGSGYRGEGTGDKGTGCGGEGGIRTHGPVAETRAFQARLFVHSSTSPGWGHLPYQC